MSEAAALEILARLGRGELTPAELLGLEAPVLDRLVTKAETLFRAGRVAEGDALLAAVARADARSVSTPFMLGALRAQHGDPEGALAAYAQALSRAQGEPRLTAKLHFARAQAWLALGAIAEALADLDRAAGGGEDLERWAAELATRLRSRQEEPR